MTQQEMVDHLRKIADDIETDAFEVTDYEMWRPIGVYEDGNAQPGAEFQIIIRMKTPKP